MIKVTAIIPCHNEAKAIGKVIRGFPVKELRVQGFDLDILVVDNNSTDNTAMVAKKAGARVVYEPRKGKGYALRTGFSEVKDTTNIVLMLDGDATYASNEAMKLLTPIAIGVADVVLGARIVNRTSMSHINRIGNSIFSLLVRVVYRTPKVDPLTGYWAWSSTVAKSLHQHITATNFSIEMEMITKVARMNYRISSIPVSYSPRIGQSNLRPFRDGVKVLQMFIRNIYWQPKVENKSTVDFDMTEIDDLA